MLEICSPPRVIKAVELLSQLNIDPGVAMDLTTEDGLGQPWDFSKQHMKDKAGNKLRKQKPDLLVDSPMCTLFFACQRLSKDKDMKAYPKHLQKARVRMELSCTFYWQKSKSCEDGEERLAKHVRRWGLNTFD